MAMSSTDRVRLHRARRRGLLAGNGGGPDLFGFTPAPPETPPAAPAPSPATRAAGDGQAHQAGAAVTGSGAGDFGAPGPGASPSPPAPPQELPALRGPVLSPTTNPDRPDVRAVVRFLRRLKVSQGRRVGQRLEVLPWQREFLEGALAPGIFESALSMGRGGGKTAFLSAVLCACLAGPLRQRRGDVLLVAASFEQARVAFEFALAYLAPWIAGEPGAWRVEDSSNRARITHRPTGARVRCIAAKPETAHGLAPALAILDEPAQWPVNTAEKMLAAVRTAAGKLPGSRRWMIGTRPEDESHFFEKALRGGPAAFAMRFAADPEGDEFAEDQWLAANPSLPHLPDLREAIAAEAEAARAEGGAALASFRALRLNMGESDEVTAVLLDAAAWQRIETPDAPAEGPWVLGLDLASGAAMTAAAAHWMDTGRLEAVAAYPSVPDLRARGRFDGVGDLYQRIHRRGELVVNGTHAIDLPAFLAGLRDRRWGTPVAIYADRFRGRELREALARAQFPRVPLCLRGQGYKDGSEDVRGFRAACLEGHVRPVPSLLLRSALREARTVSDTAANAKLARKGEGGGRRARGRDDAIAAGILAVAAVHRNRRKRQRAAA